MNTNLGLASHAAATGGGAGGNSGKEMELELGLGLGLGLSLTTSGGGYGTTTNANSTTKEAISSITRNVSGTKRAATDSLTPSHPATPSNSASQVVGWPPIKTYRMNNLVNHAKTAKNVGEEEKGVGGNDDGEGKSELKKKNVITSNNNDAVVKETGPSGFVKVNMDGLPIGRKVDLSAHTCYETLAQLLEEMFSKPSTSIGTICGQRQQPEQQSKLLDGSSEFVLTYEDKEGDFMLVGDVPWSMFLSTVKRLRIMKTSEANGLAPRFQDRQNTKPI